MTDTQNRLNRTIEVSSSMILFGFSAFFVWLLINFVFDGAMYRHIFLLAFTSLTFFGLGLAIFSRSVTGKMNGWQ